MSNLIQSSKKNLFPSSIQNEQIVCISCSISFYGHFCCCYSFKYDLFTSATKYYILMQKHLSQHYLNKLNENYEFACLSISLHVCEWCSPPAGYFLNNFMSFSFTFWNGRAFVTGLIKIWIGNAWKNLFSKVQIENRGNEESSEKYLWTRSEVYSVRCHEQYNFSLFSWKSLLLLLLLYVFLWYLIRVKYIGHCYGNPT